MSSLFPGLVTSVWHQRHETGEFDSIGHLALVFETKFSTEVRGNLKLPRYKFAEKGGLFVINNFNFFLTTDTLCFDHDMFLNETSNSDCDVELLENCHPINFTL